MNLKSLVLPEGALFLQDLDDVRSMAIALDLGLYPFILERLKSTDGPRGCAAIERSGDWLVAVLAWERCDAGNGWATLSISPANEETMLFLSRLCRALIEGTDSTDGDGFPGN
jgi:hypothetical protein